MKKHIFLLLLIVITTPVISQDSDSSDAKKEISLTEERKRTLRFGIDSEILPVLESVSEEKDSAFVEEVENLFAESFNEKIKIACRVYLKALVEELGLEDVLDIISDYENHGTDLVAAVLDYLSSIENEKALELMKVIVEEKNDGKVLLAAIRGLSKAGAEDAAELFIEKYKSGDLGTALKAELLLAFGRLKSKETIPLLTGIVADDVEEPVLRRYACTALGEIGDPASIDVLLDAYSSDDPIFRNYALNAIGMIEKPETSSILIQALRDDYYKIRITAAEALGERKVKKAVPILVYKAEKDPQIAVRTAAAEALGKIGTDEGIAKLKEFAKGERVNLQVRLSAIEVLIEYQLGKSKQLLKELILKEWDKQNSVILERICRVLSFTEAKGLAEMFELMLDHPTVIVKIHGLRGIRINRIRSLREKVESLAKEGSAASVRKHAASALEALK